MLPSITDANVIGAFSSGTTCESLVHKLMSKGLRATKEFLNSTMSCGSGEEPVRAIFDRARGRAKLEEAASGDAPNPRLL